jgi:hypothetical protein
MRNLLALVVLVVALGFAAWKAGPGILRDWSLRNDYAPVAAADVIGECRTYVAIFKYCDITLATADGAAAKDTLFFVDINSDDYGVNVVVASPSNPGQLSTSIGIEKFWNRVATLGGLAVLIVIWLFAALLRRGAAAPT